MPDGFALGLLALLTLAVFRELLFFPQGRVISAFGHDLSGEFVHWRGFGFRELRAGNLPLWNPYSFCGTPFFGGFQSALLYPLNLLFLVLPLGPAVNWSIALHVYLAGAFTYLWARNRGLNPVACLLSAATFMFCGAYFLHIFAGHLSNLCTMVWAPLLFLAIDRVLARPSLGPSLLGIFAAVMAVLAGHVQYVFYLAVAAGIYSGLNLVKARERMKVALCLGAMCLGAGGLGAVQLFTGLQEAGESLRAGRVTYDFATVFSFPPENLLTLIAPWFFGDMKEAPYWGRCYLYEMSVFVSMTGLVLAIYGAVRGDRSARRFSLTLVVVSLVLALGAHTPFFELLYYYVPGFNKFRGSSKFIFVASLFLAMLAGVGLDRLLNRARVPRGLIWGVLGAGILICGATLWLSHATLAPSLDAWWPSTIRSVQRTGEIFVQAAVPAGTFEDPRFPAKAGGIACESLLLGGAALLMLAVLLFLTNRSRRWLCAVCGLALVELFSFARGSVASFPLAKTTYPAVTQLVRSHPGSYRILNLNGPNSAMTTGVPDIWGDDPGVLRRTAQFLGFSQGIAPDEIRQFIPVTNIPPAFAMLGCRFVFPREGGGLTFQETKTPPVPRLYLVDRYRVLTNQLEILSALTNAAFNPREEVILESAPAPLPEPAGEKGTVKLLDSSTDFLTIEADVKSPAILLITDSYSRGWRVRPLAGTTQQRYEVLPANYCLRAIPLARGHHRFRMEYAPLGFRIGRWISLASVVVFVALLGFCFSRGRRPALASYASADGKDLEDKVGDGEAAESMAASRSATQQGLTETRSAGAVPSEASAEQAGGGRLSSKGAFGEKESDPVGFKVGVAIIVALVFLTYLPSLKPEFLWDDDTTLTQNTLVKAPDGLVGIWCSTRTHDYWPLTFTSFWLEWRVWGQHAVGYRVTNVLLHALSAVLLWLVLRRLKLPGAWWAALIYGLHPVCVASVAWIAERKNTLSMVFYLLSLLWFLQADEAGSSRFDARSLRFYWLALGAFLLAVLSKSSVVILPLVLLIGLAWRRHALRRVDFLRLAPFVALALVSGIVTVWFQQHRAFGGGPPTAPLVGRLLAGSWALWFYLSKALVPLNLNVLYERWQIDPQSWISYLPALGWVLLLGLLWSLRSRLGRGWFFGLAYFTVCLLPVAGLFDMYYFTYSWAADHWQYLALLGIVVLVVSGSSFLVGKRGGDMAWLQYGLAGAALLLGVSSWQRAALYGSAELLWKDAFLRNPGSWVACNNLANAMDDKSQAKQALDLYQAALQIHPDYAEAHNNLATLYTRLGKETEAVAHYTEALRLSPGFAEAHNNLGSLLLSQGKLQEAQAHFTEALRLQPDYADARYNLGNLLEKEGKPADAFQQYVLAFQINPGFAQAYYNAGNLRALQGNYTDAVRFFSKAVESAPAFAEAHYNLGIALARLGQGAAADLHLREALRLNPALAPATNHVDSPGNRR